MPSTFYQDPVFNESVSSVTLTPSVQLGAVRMEAGDQYLYVYNNGGASINVGRGCIISAVTGYSVTVSSLTNVGGFLGVVKHNTIMTASYGWIVTRGFTPVLAAATAITSGAPLYAGVDGSFTESTGALTQPAQGYCVTATAAGGIGYGYVRCFGA